VQFPGMITKLVSDLHINTKIETNIVNLPGPKGHKMLEKLCAMGHTFCGHQQQFPWPDKDHLRVDRPWPAIVQKLRVKLKQLNFSKSHHKFRNNSLVNFIEFFTVQPVRLDKFLCCYFETLLDYVAHDFPCFAFLYCMWQD
jgi:hypothetical protein